MFLWFAAFAGVDYWQRSDAALGVAGIVCCQRSAATLVVASLARWPPLRADAASAALCSLLLLHTWTMQSKSCGFFLAHLSIISFLIGSRTIFPMARLPVCLLAPIAAVPALKLSGMSGRLCDHHGLLLSLLQYGQKLRASLPH